MEDEIQKWMKKIEEVKKGEVDLSRDEDLSIALMNLISLEEHFYFTAMKTSNQKYLEMLNSVRNLRKSLLAKIVTNPQGEEWCISKHLLATSMRLIEVGTKELSKGNVKEANMFFTSAFNLYSLFFAINMKMVETENLKDDFKNLETLENQRFSGPKKFGKFLREQEDRNGILNKFSIIIKKIVDCCKE